MWYGAHELERWPSLPAASSSPGQGSRTFSAGVRGSASGRLMCATKIASYNNCMFVRAVSFTAQTIGIVFEFTDTLVS